MMRGMVVTHGDVAFLRAEASPSRSPWRAPRGAGDEASAAGSSAAGRHRPCERSGPERLPSNLVGVKILVVDDDETTLDYFATALRMCGAMVMAAATARDGMKMLGQMLPDVILTDLAMPNEDGYWLLEQVRRHPHDALRGVPVVAATAYTREHSRARTLAAGFVDYLQKPLDPEALCRAIARAVGR